MPQATQFLRFADEKGSLLVEGESLDDEHHDEIDITSWSWSVTDPAVQPGKPKGSAAQGVAGAKAPTTKLKDEGESDRRPKPSTLTFGKFTDRSTPRLLQAMEAGTFFPKAILTIEEKFEDAPNKFRMTVELAEAVVVNLTWSASAESAGMTFSEEWTVNYSQVHFAYDWREDKSARMAPGIIDQLFDRPPDAPGDAATKSPLTATEKRDKDVANVKDILARNPQLVPKNQPRGR
jgi:type VI secretion system secreted protein Hcp